MSSCPDIPHWWTVTQKCKLHEFSPHLKTKWDLNVSLAPKKTWLPQLSRRLRNECPKWFQYPRHTIDYCIEGSFDSTWSCPVFLRVYPCRSHNPLCGTKSSGTAACFRDFRNNTKLLAIVHSHPLRVFHLRP